MWIDFSLTCAGAHTLGRAYPNRSGFGKEFTKYTKDGPGTKGGSSWTPEWYEPFIPCSHGQIHHHIVVVC